MSWVAIVEMIISILSMVLEFLNGGSFPKPKTLVADASSSYHLVSYESICGSPFWSEAPVVAGGEFKGTLAVDCEVQGTSGGGLRALRRHFNDQVYTVASAITGPQQVKSVGELPATAQKVVMTMETDEKNYDVGGESTLATNGFNQLRHIFQTTNIPQEGSLSYLKAVNNEVFVQTASREGWYKVRFTYGSRIAKPWYVGASTFRDVVAKKSEEKLQNRLQRMLNDLAANL